MIKIALNNLWNRRGRYGFLLVELIAVSVLSWAVLDRLMVLNYQYNQPLGYDADLLCLIETQHIKKYESGYDAAYEANGGTDREAFMRLLADMRALPEVDKATPVYGNLILEVNDGMTMTYRMPDGRWVKIKNVTYFPEQDFFTTFGIKGPDGEDISEYLSNLGGSGRISPKVYISAKYPGINPYNLNDSLRAANEERQRNLPPGVYVKGGDTPLLGMTWPIRAYSTSGYSFVPEFDTPFSADAWGNAIVVRLKPGVNRDLFVSTMLGRMSEFRAGNTRVSAVRSYGELSEELQNRESGPERRLDKIFALFFLLNVCLGVSGTFWMMTRKRAPEVGVLRAFGFSPANVRALLASEALLLSVGAWIIGCVLYLFYALKVGLYMGNADADAFTIGTSWVESFPLHFAVISLIVLVLVVVAVVIGVAGPGWKLSRVNPVDALRDE